LGEKRKEKKTKEEMRDKTKRKLRTVKPKREMRGREGAQGGKERFGRGKVDVS